MPDFATLENLRKNHPAWRLLCAQHAPIIISFLHRVFVAPNRRTIAQADLVEALEDELFALREEYGASAFLETAISYLNSWAENDKGWLRKFYPHGTDEPHFDLTPATEKAITWVSSLTERSFVGTESRLHPLFELLRQMDEGTQNDPKVRRRKRELEHQIAELEKGRVDLLDDTGLKERFAQFQQLARERETIRERIASINASLTGIDYNPGRYIRLEAQANTDSDIREFQSELKACTEGALTGSEDNLYSESKFLQVQKLIERFRGRKDSAEADRRWTTRVTDVRNWFVFAASERFREDDTEYEHYADSGGQKEKLAYTVLAASLAYQFGLEWGNVRSRSFRLSPGFPRFPSSTGGISTPTALPF